MRQKINLEWRWRQKQPIIREYSGQIVQNFENLRSSVAGEILILSNQLNNIPLNQAQTYPSQTSLPRFELSSCAQNQVQLITIRRKYLISNPSLISGFPQQPSHGCLSLGDHEPGRVSKVRHLRRRDS